MKYMETLKDLPGTPKLPGKLLSIGKNRGDLHHSDILAFASNERMRAHEHQLMWAYKDPDQVYVADQVTPVVGVSSITSDYRLLAEDTFYNEPSVDTGRVDRPKLVEFRSTLANIDLTGRTLAVALPDVDKADAVSQFGSVQKWRDINIKMLKRLIQLHRERTVATLYQTAGNFATGFKGTLEASDWASYKYWDDTQALPLECFIQASRGLINTSYRPLAPLDTIIVGDDVDAKLRLCPDVKDAVTISAAQREAGRPIVSDEAIRQYFGVANYIPARAMYNSTSYQSTATISPIWGKYAIFCHLGATLGGDELSAAFAKTCQLDTKELPNYKGYTVRSVRDELMGGLGGEIVVCIYWAQEKIFSQKVGYQLQVLA
jgi:hypothetical protein